MKITLKTLIPFLFFGLLAFNSYSQTKPNIVIILADDLGYGDVQCYNLQRGKIPTPNIDRLAASGMRFTDGHSSSGICSPSRYTLLTGRYHWRSRLQKGIVDMWEKPLITPDRLTIASLAKQAGYRTAALGKWHLGWNWPIDPEDRSHFTDTGPFEGQSRNGTALKSVATEDDRAAWKRTFAKAITGGPIELGFDSYFGTDVPNWPPFCFIKNDRTVGVPGELLGRNQVDINQASFQGPALEGWDLEQILPTLAARATTFIAEQVKAKQPFMLYFSLTSPHTPLAVTDNWKNKSGLNNSYADFVMQTDAVVGEVLDELKANGVEDNTIVFFLSDNGCGPYIGVKELETLGHFASGPLRGYKGDVWEGGHRTPFIVRFPGVTKAGSVSDQLVLHADVMATLANIFDKKLPDNAGEDSFSLLPLLKGSKKAIRKNGVACRYDGLQAVRMGSWKLICTTDPELYNVAEDIGETRNVAAENQKLVIDMLSLRKKLISDGRSTPGAIQQNDVEVNLSPGP
ncbi:MAG: arylsulfatase [Cyclobacteriaceae bacterium]